MFLTESYSMAFLNPESTTKATPSIVIDVSAISVEKITFLSSHYSNIFYCSSASNLPYNAYTLQANVV
jgi:hypothetical protein